jgi:hypothetical protein
VHGAKLMMIKQTYFFCPFFLYLYGMSSKNSKGRTEIQITNVAPEKKQQLQAIAKNNFTTMAALLKPKIDEVIESYPAMDRVIYED